VQSLAKSFSIALVTIAIGVASGRVLADTVLITGANQGIGLEFAKQYAARGWTVIATHRRTTTPEELATLAAKYPKVRVERMDVTDATQIEALGAKLEGMPIDVLLSNAGLVRTDPIDQPGGNTNQAIGKMIKTIDGLGIKDSGRFMDNDGKDHPW
jgi:NADP-dependent 3-hydroxy acid dehydrogenase YdfG